MNISEELIVKRAEEWFEEVKRTAHWATHAERDDLKRKYEEQLTALLCCSLCAGSIDELADDAVYKIAENGGCTFQHKGITFQVAQLVDIGTNCTGIHPYFDVACVLIDRLDPDSKEDEPIWIYDFVPGAWMYGAGEIKHLDIVDDIFINACDKYINKYGLDTLLKEQERK